MPDESVLEAAAPSATEVTSTEHTEVELPRGGTKEYAEWRIGGTIPEKPKTADSTTADKPKEATSEVVPAPEPGKQESRRKPDAEARIRELTEENRRNKAELEELRKPKETKAEPSPARQPEETRPKPKVDDQTQDGKPKYATYEDYVEELADWKAEQRIATQERERTAAHQRTELSKQLEEARGRYTDYDSVASPVIQELLKPDVPREIFAVINDSPVLADLLYTIGGTESSKADFLAACRSNPSKALRVALLMEQEIVKELAKGSDSTQRNDRGQFVAPKEPEVKTPAKRGPESAAEPPIEIGHRGSSVKDESQRALEDMERGDENAFRRYMRAENAKAIRR